MSKISTQQNSFKPTEDYKKLLCELKNKIRSSRFQAALSVNKEVIKLYWYIGKQIVERQKVSAWGAKLIEVLSMDLRNAFPETSGFQSQI